MDPKATPATTVVEPSDAQAIIDAVSRLSVEEAMEFKKDGLTAEVLILPSGKTAQSIKPFLDEYRTAPERRQGTATLTALDSFISHVNRFKDADSAIFAETANPARLEAVLDYHRAGGDGAPRFGRHRAVYSFPTSEEWRAWTGQTRAMLMNDFAEFLEDRVVDVVDPAQLEADRMRNLAPGEIPPPMTKAVSLARDLGLTLATPQQLLTLSRELSIRVKQGVSNAIKLTSGESQVSFTEEHEAHDKKGGQLLVPGGFLISIPPLRGGEPYLLLVRLRYRVEGAKISFTLAIHRQAKTWETAVEDGCTRAQIATDLPLFFGQPE